MSRAFATVCDDLVVFTDTEAEGVQIDEELSTAYAGAGLERHLGKQVVSALSGGVLGLMFYGVGRLTPKGHRMRLLIRATTEALARYMLSPHVVGKIVGHWT